MPAVFHTARRTTARYALAVALVGGFAMTATAMLPEPAYAQRNRDRNRNAEASQAEGQTNSQGFAAAYQPVAAMVQPATANYEGARAAIPALVAAVENDADRDLAGNLILNIGSHFEDRQMQLQGLTMRLQSGRVAPDQQGLFNWYAGNISYELDNYADARRYLQQSVDLGYQPDQGDAVLLIANSYVDESDNAQQAVDYLMQRVAAATTAGQTPPEAWLMNALQLSYDNELAVQALDVGEMVVTNYPTERNLANALQIVSQLNEFSPQARIDLYRLMLAAGVLRERQDISRYIDDLDARVRGTEVQRALALGLANNVYTSSDPYYTDVLSVATPRASADRSGLATIVREGENGDGLDAINAGDILYSMEDYTRAAAMYQLALDRGYDADLARTRLGMVQSLGGDNAAALATFAQVSGERQPIARMWTAWINSQAS
ncbi:hypothetical protein GRI62_05870 [Erythrobacter arachoides]|uniref:Tetratricopeptide repeat protein n=1 Tax=Aurantiacibacter arachoides TaxID=1850444 RepID=A0A844ZYB1_9SPHN|nr:hypothetical protein [Aurantiacibacter arachoides]MXO93133.1 hypothetical protein [Aurantiacibacter arachoides]GGD51791.1 hypothetical protein GCM10011411_09520 [Aurantiacibacter arachoides]